MVYGLNGKNLTTPEKGEQKLNRHTVAIRAANGQYGIWF